MDKAISSVLVAARGALGKTGGGVQQAAQEYVAALKLAGCQLTVVPFDGRANALARLWNRIRPQVMLVQPHRQLVGEIETALREAKPEFVFFLPNIFPSVSRAIRQRAPDIQQILLSVGVESIDFIVDLQIRRRNRTENRLRGRVDRMLGRQLITESEQRCLLDAVLTMSPLEAEVEKWLGAPRSLWLPRTVNERPLDVHPVEGRVGCVSTLNHPPNLDGLVQVLEQLASDVPQSFRFRLVGSPEENGRRIAARFHFVDYLGKLSDAELRQEAATWCCFVHPLFVYAKGSSTKLAVGLGWGLPIATTEFGARGYAWDQRVVPLASNPAQLKNLVLQCAQSRNYDAMSRQVSEIVAATPKLNDVAADIRRLLLEMRLVRQHVSMGVAASHS